MKDKKLAYLLLPAVLVVWGLIIHRVADAVGEPDAGGPPAASAPAARPDERPAVADTLPPSLRRRDPFLDESSASARRPAAPAAVRTARPPAPAPPAATPPPAPVAAAWPAVRYMGMIHNGNSRTRVAIVHIGGRSHLLAAGGQAGGVRVTAIAADSVGLAFGGQFRQVRR